jgi:hypothetical protein
MPLITPTKNHATPGKAMLASVTGYAMDGFDLLNPRLYAAGHQYRNGIEFLNRIDSDTLGTIG